MKAADFVETMCIPVANEFFNFIRPLIQLSQVIPESYNVSFFILKGIDTLFP